MTSRPFLDANIVVHAFLQKGRKSVRARDVMASGGIISIFVLNEFTNVMRRTLRWDWNDIGNAVGQVLQLCPQPLAASLPLHHAARRTAQRYGYSVFDALALACAAEAGCRTVFSEDMQHGQVIDGTLTVKNPFLL